MNLEWKIRYFIKKQVGHIMHKSCYFKWTDVQKLTPQSIIIIIIIIGSTALGGPWPPLEVS
jgi:hypothetical protein